VQGIDDVAGRDGLMIIQFIKNPYFGKRITAVEDISVEKPDDIGIESVEGPYFADVFFRHEIKVKIIVDFVNYYF